MSVCCPMSNESFKNHIQDIAKSVEASSVHIGADFAVLNFKFEYRTTKAYKNIKKYAAFYGYRLIPDKTRFVIINTN